MAITLQPYNTISLSAGTPTQLVGPLSGHYWIQILNQGGGNVGVADTSAASGGSGAFTLLPNLSVTPYVYGPSGIWVNAAAASQISVALMPVSGYTPCSAGAVQGGAATPAGTTGQVQWNNGLQMGASANLFWNNTTGRLGIHNASPAYTLDVVGNCNIAGALTVNGSPVGAGGTQWITSGSNIYYSAGNVGIGTTSPSYSLDITSSGQVGARIRHSVSTNAVCYNVANGGGSLELGVEGNPGGGLMLGGTTPYSAIFNQSLNTDMFFGTNNTARMVINATGNVGIGTTSPLVLLDLPNFNTVNSIVRFGGFEFEYTAINNGSFTDNMYWNGAAWIYRNTGFGSYIGQQSGNITFGTAASGTGGTTATTASERMRILNNGNVGIGTTNPQVLLDLPNQVANNSIARFGSIELQSLNAGNTFVCSNVYWNGSAYIYRATGSANLINFQNGDISFMTALSGTGGTTASLAFEFRILAAGGIYIPNLPTVSPGAGSKQIWADPADSYRVKFAN